MIEAAAAPQDLHGRTLGEFVLRELIGEGGFAAVYRCEQLLLGREAVIKVLHHRLRASEQVLQRFLREAQLASRLDHPYAAHVYAFGVEPDGLVWIAMELVSGITLDGWLAEHGPLSPERLVEFFRCIAEVVQTAHERGIVHRDLKPSNIMVIERAGRLLPKLLDFGIARLVDDAANPEPSGEARAANPEPAGDAANSGAATTLPPTDVPARIANPRLTQANMTLGSPSYMSPEQWLDPRSVGPASDLYSLGIMAFEALTGRLPFVSESIAGLANLHCTAEVPPLGPGFSPALDRVFHRVLAKTPDVRPANAVAFVDELLAAMTSSEAPAAAPRRKLPWLVAATVVIAAAAVVAIMLFARGDAATPSASAGPASAAGPRPVSSSAAQTPSPGSQTATSGAQTSASGSQTSVSGEQTMSSGSQTAASGSQTAASGSQTASSDSQTTSSGSQTTSSGSQTATSAHGTSAAPATASHPSADTPTAKPAKAHKSSRHKPAAPPTPPPPEDLGADRL